MSVKHANAAHPVHELIARRFSPYAFSGRPVSHADLRSLFEAARWAASANNEQPWSYIVATREDATDHARLLSCLVDANQVWAKAAPVLALGVVRTRFTRNDKPNAAARHDLGAAGAQLSLEATARGIAVHPMLGILPDRARELYAIPEHSEALTGLAIGYAASPDEAPAGLRERDQTPRTRKPLEGFVFGGRYGEASSVLSIP